jgi:hypothetical protein
MRFPSEPVDILSIYMGGEGEREEKGTKRR